jgi:hypothetical protein
VIRNRGSVAYITSDKNMKGMGLQVDFTQQLDVDVHLKSPFVSNAKPIV